MKNSHWIQCNVFMLLMGLELVTRYSEEITKAISHTREQWFLFVFFVRELVNSVVKSSRTHSSEQDLSENDWINKNLQNSLNRKVIFCFLTSVLSLQFLYLLTSLPAHLMSCEFNLCFKLRYNINKKCLGFFPSQKRRLMGMTKWNMCKVDITNMVCDCSLVSQEQTRRQPTGCRIQQWYMGLSYSVWDCGEISVDAF